jgi:hypothetical protein
MGFGGTGPPDAGRRRGIPFPPTARSYPEVVTRTRNPVRRAFHLLLVIVGWILFGAFWYFIFARGTGRGAVRTFAILFVTMVGIIVINYLWVGFNLGIHRIRGQRTQARIVPFRVRRDALGRELIGPGWDAVQRGRIVDVVIDEKNRTKRFVVEEGTSAADGGEGAS